MPHTAPSPAITTAPTADTLDERNRDPRQATEEMRGTAVSADASGDWVVLGHDEAVQVACDADSFSSAVSAHLQVPNGLNGERHAAFRRVIDPFFSARRMAALEPVLRSVARDLVAALPHLAPVDAVAEIGSVFAVRAQTRWLGWPTALEPRLLAWMDANHAATRSGERSRTAAVAADFDAIIEEVVTAKTLDGDRNDVTSELLASTVSLDGEPERPLTRPEVVSILRNWTGGDLGSIALCVGVVLHDLAVAPRLQERMRVARRPERAAIIDELLRRDDPFVSNRRVATCPVDLGGQHIEAGQRVRIHWTAANRDERVFFDPDLIRTGSHAGHNLVYGVGPHVCPGRPLATLELVVLVEALLAACRIEPSTDIPTSREVSPVGGYARVGITLRPIREEK